MSVYICGNEDIIAVSDETIEYNIRTDNFTEKITVNVTNLFNNTDPKCGFYGNLMKYSLVSTKEVMQANSKPIDDTAKQNFWLEDHDILYIDIVHLGSFEFYVLCDLVD